MSNKQNTTHTRIYLGSMILLKELNDYTGGKTPETLDRIIKFALIERDRFLERKQYNNTIRRFGGNPLNNK